jgi:cation-transporting ATPase E
LTDGLTAADVASRRAEGLGNTVVVVTSRPISQILRTNVLTRFNAILAGLLLVIIVIGPFQDGLFGVVLIANTLIGIGQEIRAKRTLDRLAVLSAPKARVRRDGVTVEVPLDELVVDDILVIGRGDQIPLDGVVVDGEIEIDESLLSGEAEPIAASSGTAVLSGSFVVAGAGSYRVERVGSDSYAQRLVGDARRFVLATSELRDGVDRFLQIVQWTIVPATVLLIVGQLRSNGGVTDAIRGSVAGVSALIPEGLILLTTVAFGVAVVRLAARRVLVQELPAVEGLARVDVLCLDKTGTLTQGGITVDGIEVLTAHPDAEAALGALAFAEIDPNPTLAAIGARWTSPPGWEVGAHKTFSSARRWSGGDFGAHGVWLLGAPEVLGVPTDTDRGQARVVALAMAPRLDPAGATPIALIRLSEELRDGAAETLAFFKRQGVSVKVISGDQTATVAAIATALGVDGADQPVDARSIDHDELAALVTQRSVFGRVSPQQKRAMVEALQERGHTVAMTGDGVNDVPALKDADIGVAMGSGSAIARGVAQLILLDDDFTALPNVIGEGRRVLANVERVASLFLTKTAYAAVLALAIGITGFAYPLLPRHLTIIDDFTIGIPAFVLALLPTAEPFRPGFVGRVLRFAIPCGVVAGAAAFIAYALAHHAGLPLIERRTVATIVLVGCGMWVLTVLARPFDLIKAVLVVAVSAGFVGMLASPRARKFFALHMPPATQLWESIALVVVAGLAIETIRVRNR